MMAGDVGLTIILILLGILSAFFSSSETALFSLDKTARSRFKHENPLTGRKVLDLISDPSKLLGTILLANLIINVFFFSIFNKLSFIVNWYESDSASYKVLSLTLPIIVLVVLGEVLPKILALRFAYRWSLVVVYPISWFKVTLSPCVRLFTKFMPTSNNESSMEANELEQLVKQSEEGGMIHKDESAHLRDLIRFGMLTVHEIMIPRADMVSFCLKDGPDKLLELFKKSGLTKIPVYHNSPDDITQAINLRHFLQRQNDNLDTLTQSIGICPEQMLLKTLYNRMRLTHQKTSIVVDEHGGTSGIITFKDLLEEIVGEFNEDFNQGDLAKQLSDGSWRISANMPLREFEELCDIDLPRGDYLTVGGYVSGKCDHMPYKGDIIVDSSIRFKVESIERQNIVNLIVSWPGVVK